jgi:beta-phosphoglucomutase-like phosphatase (HAD superfamily)
MMHPTSVASLHDVDGTLLDTEGIVATLKRHLVRAFATEREERYSRPIRPEAPEPQLKSQEEGNDERDTHTPRIGSEPLAR